MEVTILWWYWIVLGIGLMLSEIIMPSFTILWFGAAAVLVGIVVAIAPDISLEWQVIIWTVISIAFTILWFKYLKPLSIDRTKAGMSKEAMIGETGQVTDLPIGEKRGEVRFSTPLLGAEEWPFLYPDDHSTLQLGDRVIVTDIMGNTLVVQKK
ncbi:MAG: NfeD family protein [Pseudomonadales bacterium]|nr:NfeD family protein [Pseudomonadales bacterium]